jgi:hypothetical protein
MCRVPGACLLRLPTRGHEIFSKQFSRGSLPGPQGRGTARLALSSAVEH